MVEAFQSFIFWYFAVKKKTQKEKVELQTRISGFGSVATWLNTHKPKIYFDANLIK